MLITSMMLMPLGLAVAFGIIAVTQVEITQTEARRSSIF
jgi:predicted outer membrane lipoprotein